MMYGQMSVPEGDELCPECRLPLTPNAMWASCECRTVVHRTQPMPNDLIDGGTVIASVLLHDDDERPTTWVLLMLRRSTPFYEVIEVNEYGEITELGEARNIMDAAEIYGDNGGE